MGRRDSIVLKGVRLRAGSGPEGAQVRALDVRLSADLLEAAFADSLERAIDYSEVDRCLREAAAGGRGDLAERLALAVLERFPKVEEVEICAPGAAPLRRSRGGTDGPRL